ncbi:hypothetical protein HPP92_020331 [Vanilla planifolia]|uniref:Uncharacterized protein n=1 Tax=Vanilla planifolia TaxID=51239 RepID=A0A835PWW0_VANPL|nr:hypothetical protein HPP92_020734 [Vanilla planifolia]KAG0461855.1 hypothetical protein HPP92_020331 [Vanilla planifolia]
MSKEHKFSEGNGRNCGNPSKGAVGNDCIVQTRQLGDRSKGLLKIPVGFWRAALRLVGEEDQRLVKEKLKGQWEKSPKIGNRKARERLGGWLKKSLVDDSTKA